jgi:hypothetical protein
MGIDRDGNGIGEPVDVYPMPLSPRDGIPHVPATSDSFDAPRLGLQWQWYANHSDSGIR